MTKSDEDKDNEIVEADENDAVNVGQYNRL